MWTAALNPFTEASRRGTAGSGCTKRTDQKAWSAADPARLPPPGPEPAASSRERDRIQMWQWKDSRLVFSVGLGLTVLVQRAHEHARTLRGKQLRDESSRKQSHDRRLVCACSGGHLNMCVCAAHDQVCVGMCVCVVVSVWDWVLGQSGFVFLLGVYLVWYVRTNKNTICSGTEQNSITHDSFCSSFVRQTAGLAVMLFFFSFENWCQKRTPPAGVGSSFDEMLPKTNNNKTVQTKKKEAEIKNKDLRAESSNNNNNNYNNSTIGTLWSPIWGIVGEKVWVHRSQRTQANQRKKETVLEKEPSSERAAARIFPDYTIDQRDLT